MVVSSTKRLGGLTRGRTVGDLFTDVLVAACGSHSKPVESRGAAPASVGDGRSFVSGGNVRVAGVGRADNAEDDRGLDDPWIDRRDDRRDDHGVVGRIARTSVHGSRRMSRRRAVAMVMAMIAVVAAGVSLVLPQRANSAPGPVAVTSTVVRPGDTWWSYAEPLTPAGDDVSVTVDRLMTLNHESDPTLVPGQTIVLPADATSW